MTNRILIFIVAYNAERTIAEVVRRIPKELFHQYETEILLIDDASADGTFEAGYRLRSLLPERKVTVLKNPVNLGYGGNQKLGYEYAIREGFDYIVLLHGDGQYAPEQMPVLLKTLVDGDAAAVFGSRMLEGRSAIKGGMPVYKYVGNRILTALQNCLSGMRLSEWHSGYRLYSVEALSKIPFARNSNDFNFDTEIILQLNLAGHRIEEVPVPTFYGDEICHVNGLKYACQVIRDTFIASLSKFGVFHDPKFDTVDQTAVYRSKFGFSSSHQYALDAVRPGERLLILGCGPAETVRPLTEQAGEVSLVDVRLEAEHHELAANVWQLDLNELQEQDLGDQQFDCVLILDVIEHLRDPEEFLSRIRGYSQLRRARVILTTPNVVFLPVRLMFFLGQFNYGKRGILDRTHTRLFTFGSFRRLLTQQGFSVTRLEPVPAPFPLAFGENWFSRILLSFNHLAMFLFPRLFAFQIYGEANPLPTVEQLLTDAEFHSEGLRDLVA
ncbi:glycosyltransferase [Roseiconus nitratireducens]|uniref:Glycosyltransferase n=1 Tax=Roseiconus nitratireducens TaxID=2605748 RepID=A0A5M6D4V7_9BACT|nr:glycosyltransferase [Roseiconus nitratireducens]KAA5541342.1 glycosyltransferase [Roseiconus nitratireducens]